MMWLVEAGYVYPIDIQYQFSVDDGEVAGLSEKNVRIVNPFLLPGTGRNIMHRV